MKEREYKRFETDQNLFAETYLTEKQKIKNKIKNLSMGGVCLETFQRMTHNNIYIIEMESKGKEEIMVAGIVIWSTLRKTVKKDNNVIPLYDVGLKFLDLNDSEKLHLNNIISKYSH